MPGFTGPTHLKMAPYVLQALQELGGKAPYAEIDQRVIDIMGLSNDVAAFPHGDTARTEVAYRLAWARTDLKKVGMIDNPSMGVWEIKPEGIEAANGDSAEVVKRIRAMRALERTGSKSSPTTGGDTEYSVELDISDPQDSEILDTLEKAYFVGASIDGQDKTDEFVEQGTWRCGYETKYADQINGIEPGDRIAIKASFTRKYGLPFDNHGENVSAMRIKARGVVRYNPRDGKTLRVDWEKGYEPRDWYFLTLRQAFYRIERDLEDWKRGALLDFAFADDVQDIEAFLADPYWVGQYDAVPEEGAVEPSGDAEEGVAPDPYGARDFLREVFMDEQEYAKLVSLLERKGNVILQGAPGTGKTFAARRLAWSLMGERADARIRFVQFHQNTTYEDMIVGYRPTESGGFDLKNGIFTRFCEQAAASPSKKHFFIIDEINRANVSKVMGEMLVAVEKSHRSAIVDVRLQGGRNGFSVPENVYIVGMMNTADRSIAMMDYALRRRFAFFELEPAFGREGLLRNLLERLPEGFARALVQEVIALNARIEDERGRAYRIGHSYFLSFPASDGVMSEDECRVWLSSIVEYEIVPLLREYWFDASPDQIEGYVRGLLALAAGER